MPCYARLRGGRWRGSPARHVSPGGDPPPTRRHPRLERPATQLDDRGFAVTAAAARPRPSATRWPSSSTAAASARRSTWPATASATAATATSTTRCRTRSRRCARLLRATSRRSPTTGRSGSAATPTFPLDHEELLARCREAGQKRPTPLILRYGAGDWNALHQDLYGDVYFPFQVLTVLEPDGFDGGEFVLLEQRPRAQSRAHVLTPPPGAFVIFPTRERPNAEQARLPPGRPAPRREHGDARVADRARRSSSTTRASS